MDFPQCELCATPGTALILEPDPFMDRRFSDIHRVRVVCAECHRRFSNHDDVRFTPFHSTVTSL